MKVDLDKKALMSLVMGMAPNYALFEHPTVTSQGRWDGSRGNWVWYGQGNLQFLTEKELYDLYKMCRESWD